MRNILEEQNDLHKWINLIFGNRQKYSYYEGKQFKNYEKYCEVKYKNDKKKYNNDFVLALADFGLLPYQLFNKDFPSKDLKYSNDKILNNLNNLNLELFNEEHIN